MKDDLKTSLKAEAYKPQDNPTFVPRVLNRLPERRRRSYAWILPLAYALSFIILIIYSAIALNEGGSFAEHRLLLISIAVLIFGLLYTIIRPLLRGLI